MKAILKLWKSGDQVIQRNECGDFLKSGNSSQKYTLSHAEVSNSPLSKPVFLHFRPVNLN